MTLISSTKNTPSLDNISSVRPTTIQRQVLIKSILDKINGECGCFLPESDAVFQSCCKISSEFSSSNFKPSLDGLYTFVLASPQNVDLTKVKSELKFHKALMTETLFQLGCQAED